jgi:SulP family sulfate permease
MKIHSLTTLRQDLHPHRLLPIVTVAIISGLVVTTYQISFGSLIFSGDLSSYLSSGIGFCLMGVVLIGGIEALLSGNPGMVAIPTVSSSVIVATIGAGIARELSGAPDKVFPTVTAAITVTSLLTGGTFLALGWFRLGNLIRYIPYPVIGGFLAGTGWLVVSGAFKTMNGIPLSLANLGRFAQGEALLRWLPGVIYGVILLLLVRRFKHYLITPLMILGAVVLFYLILWLTGTSIERATDLGLLFKPFPPGALWQPPPLGDLAIVDWGSITHQVGEMATLLLISSITLLLYASGVEVTAGREIDLNQELRACGAGNLAAAFSASPPGYTIITMSVLSNRLGANSRLVGLFMAAICTGVMFFGGPLIAMFPKPALGGVLTFLGLTFLADWLYDGWRKLSRADYLIVVTILLVMSASGLLPGLGVGIALAAGLFIVQYSRVPVVRHTFSGRSYRSRVERSLPHAELLRQEGSALTILELQGYVFFGTANSVYEQLKERLDSTHGSPPRIVMLDFRRVNGVDASAALSFVRLKRLLRQNKVVLVFTHLRPDIEHQLRRDVLTPEDEATWHLFPDLDHAVEWFEEQVLQGEAGLQAAIQAQPGAVQAGQERGGLALLFSALGVEAESMDEATDKALLRLMGYLDRVTLKAGEPLIRQGEHHRYLYFLDTGELTVEYRTEEKKPVRLETSGPGSIVGELGMYLNTPAAATVIAARPSTVYRLSSDGLHRMEREDPLAAGILHRFLLKRVGRRLLATLETVEALSD